MYPKDVCKQLWYLTFMRKLYSPNYLFILSLIFLSQLSLANDVYLECKGSFIAKNWKNPFLIVRSQNNSDETIKTISIGFSLLDIGYSKKAENEFTVSKEGWHGSLYFRDVEFRITPEFYIYKDPEQSQYNWEDITIKRTDLSMGYYKFNRFENIDSGRIGYGCDVVSKSVFKESIQKIINKGWKRGIRAEAKRLKKIQEKEKELANPAI